MTLEELLAGPVHTLPPADKQSLLLAGLEELTAHHRARCHDYDRMLARLWPGRPRARTLAELPWLPVGLFKRRLLRSIPESEVFRTMHSSGTTGQARSRVVLDRATAALQGRALASILRTLLGRQRLPMLLVESQAQARGAQRFTARQAGVLGMMPYGRDHLFLLDEAGQPRRAELRAWLERHGQAPFLVFAFTFMAWLHLVQGELQADLSQGILVHTGGWKRLQEQAVDRKELRRRLRAATGLRRVHDLYGMVEQTGSVFLELEEDRLLAPAFADVLVRDPKTLEPLPPGQPGLLQVLSLLPRSYPGHSLLTGDLGVVLAEDGPPGGLRGRRLQVLGRAPRAVLRGCSDTRTVVR